ncbi:MAG: DNA polymerase III subunit alpha [Bacteroidales bacterium]|nr:DNA polymerase III subunit alpha [Bacteroidales bacterium]
MSYFVHLHVHTEYSTLDGASKIPALVNKAIGDGMQALAITDHGNMFGVKEFLNYINKKNKSVYEEIKRLKSLIGENSFSDAAPEDERDIPACEEKMEKLRGKLFKPIVGCEVYVAVGSRFDKKTKEDASGDHLILLAKNKKGYHNLVKMVSKGFIEGKYYKPRIDKELLSQYHEGLIVSSACLGGEVPQHILNGHPDRAEETVLWFKALFGEDYYIEIQRHPTSDPSAATEVYPKQQKVNAVLIELARKHHIPLIATNDVHFVEEEEAEAHDRLLCLNTNADVNDPNRMRYTKQEWFKTTAEMERLFQDLPEVLSNTCQIADKIEIYSIDSKPVMPDFPLPEGFSDNETYFRHLAWEGAKTRYPEITDEIRERIEFEMNVICTMGFSGYFLIVQDFIAAARKMGVSVGPGRGSAAGSVVAYCLRITDIDPLRYDLLFERFLNPDRISMPDIDIDFDDDGRAKVINWVTEKYGKEKVARIITFGTMATKSAIKDVARVQQVPLPEANRLTDLIPDRLPDKDGEPVKITIRNCIENVPELKQALESDNKMLSDTLKYAAMLEGTVRQTGIHACGIIIGKSDLTDYIPIATAYDKEYDEDVLVTQYEGSLIEEVGMLKMDFLGLKNLSIIQEALANIRNRIGEEIDINAISLDDPATYALFCNGDTVGTFQFESDGMRKYLRELKPSQFEDLIAMSALYRPGPMDYIPDFIARKQGKKPISYDIPVMERYLKDTYGITVYQEQVMLLSQLLANFTRSQGDELRKAMGKKQKDKMAALKVKFFDGCQANHYDEKVITKIWEDWEKFASYAFNKSHATCYAFVAYQTAWLKARYPADYMAALLSRNISDISEITKYMDECRRMGIQVLGPDVNESNLKFTVNQVGNIRFGLQAIKGVGESAALSIINERKSNGAFSDTLNFFERISLTTCGKKNIESLVLAGAFDNLGVKREQFFAPMGKDATFLETLCHYSALYQKDNQSLSGGLFGDLAPIQINKPEPPMADEWSVLEKLNKEKELVGIYLSAHPLDPCQFEWKYFTNQTLTDLNDLSGLRNKDLSFAGIIISVRHDISKTGRPWGRMAIEDFSGSHEFSLFGKDYEKFSSYMVKGHCVWVKASVQDSYRNGEPEIKIQSIRLLGNIREELLKRFSICIPVEKLSASVITALKEVADRSVGNVTLRFVLSRPSDNISVGMFSRKQRITVSNELIETLDTFGFEYNIN